jgi:hypothetical protein
LEEEIQEENRVRLGRGFIAGPVDVTVEILPDHAFLAGFRQAFILKPEGIFQKIDVVLYEILGHDSPP